MKIQRFEGIIAWQRVKDWEVSIYTEFSGNKDFRFKDQIQRSEKTFHFQLVCLHHKKFRRKRVRWEFQQSNP
jgi:hypothetical protein